MTDLAGFLAAAVAAAIVWGRALWYLDERSPAFRRGVLFALGYTRRASGEVRALLLSSIYYLLGCLIALAFLAAYALPVSGMFAVSASHLGLAVLGIIGEISLGNLLVGLGAAVLRAGPERFAEIREIPWMKGLRELPEGAVPVAAALGGLVEELVFRGVLLLVLVERLGVEPWAAVAITGALFCLEQLVQVRSGFQAVVIGGGCVAISLVGGLLVTITGSVVPALLCHASFVIFFMPAPGRREVVAA